MKKTILIYALVLLPFMAISQENSNRTDHEHEHEPYVLPTQKVYSTVAGVITKRSPSDKIIIGDAENGKFTIRSLDGSSGDIELANLRDYKSKDLGSGIRKEYSKATDLSSNLDMEITVIYINDVAVEFRIGAYDEDLTLIYTF